MPKKRSRIGGDASEADTITVTASSLCLSSFSVCLRFAKAASRSSRVLLAGESVANRALFCFSSATFRAGMANGFCLLSSQ